MRQCQSHKQVNDKMYKRIKGACRVTLLVVLGFAGVGVTGASDGSVTGFLDVNFYPYLSDTDSDNYLTINAAADFGNEISYFSLSNFGNMISSDGQPDKNTFYTEQNIRWRVDRGLPLDLTIQLNFRSGGRNDRHRLGVRWRLSDTENLSSFFKAINMTYAINWHAIQFDHEEGFVWQLEHAFKFHFPNLSNRLYLAGFVDHTFNQTLPAGFPKRPVVAEAQLGYRLFDQIYAIAEFRINEYRRSDVDNLGLGVQYKASW